jgi:hypothetical protein
MYVLSRELRDWCWQNRNRFYVPEWLLRELRITVDPNFSGAARPLRHFEVISISTEFTQLKHRDPLDRDSYFCNAARVPRFLAGADPGKKKELSLQLVLSQEWGSPRQCSRRRATE